MNPAQQTLDSLFSMLAASAGKQAPSLDELIQPKPATVRVCPACGTTDFKLNADGGIRRHPRHLGGNRIAQCNG